MNASVFNFSSCLLFLHHFIAMCVSTASSVVRRSLRLICTCICMCIVIDININQQHLFWVALGYHMTKHFQLYGICKHGEGHVISHHSMCIGMHMSWYYETFIHYQLMISYLRLSHLYRWMGYTNRRSTLPAVKEKLGTIVILVQWQ